MRRVGVLVRVVVGCAAVAALAAALMGFRSAGSSGPVGRIVLTERVGKGLDLYLVNANSTQLRRLTRDTQSEGSQGNQSPTWSPDGRSIAFIHYGSPTDPHANALVRMPATGGRRVTLVNGPLTGAFLAHPVWSPNGKWVAYEGGDGIDLYPTSGGQPRNVIPTFAAHPSWSPDSRQIAYTALNAAGHTSVFIAGADGSTAHDVSQAPVADEGPVWSANGKWIAMRSLNAEWQQHEEDSLVLISPDGSNRRTLLSGGAIFPLASSPSGNAVLVLREPDPKVLSGQFWIVPVSGGGQPQRLTGTNNAVDGAWHR